MKLQAIKKRCLATKRMIIINAEDGSQWIYDGRNYCRILGIQLREAWLQEVFGLKNKQMENMFINTENRPDAIFCDGYKPIGEGVDYIRDVWAFDQRIHAFAAGQSVLYITEDSTKPSRFEDYYDVRLLYDQKRNPLVGVYEGMFCDALLEPIPAEFAERIRRNMLEIVDMPTFGLEVSENEEAVTPYAIRTPNGGARTRDESGSPSRP